MTTLRQPYSELSPEIYKGLVQASIALEKANWAARWWSWSICGCRKLTAALFSAVQRTEPGNL